MKKYLIHFVLLFSSFFAIAQPGWIVPDRPRPLPIPNPRPNAALFELELRTCKVETDIQDMSATTQLEQVFFNPADVAWQGYYLYPLPGITAVKKFSMFVNGKEIEAELLDAAKAKELYEGIVRKFQDPAILEYYNYGAIKMKIFPVPPRSEVRIKLSYVQSLPKDNGLMEYWMPFRQKEMQQKNVGDISLRVRVNQTEEIKNIYCPTHATEINRKGAHEATVGFEQKNLRSDQDFRLFIRTDKNKIGATLLTYNDATEDGYFYLDLSPGFVTRENTTAKDITFVVDASGSMSGDNMEQAKRALQFCINNLNPDDRFNIVRFSTEANTLFDGLQNADEPHVDKAKEFIQQMKAIGGTNMEEAFEQAFAMTQSPGRPYFIVFMTDGKPTIGETIEDHLVKKVSEKNKSNTRIFTLGIGTDLNTHLLDRLTEMTKAFRTYILPTEDIEIKVSDFYTKVASPILTDISLKMEGINATDLYPKVLPDLFAGSSLGIFGRYKNSGTATVTLRGKVNGKEETFVYQLEFDRNNKKNDFIPPLWATRAVGYLLDQIRLNGENKELKDEIVRLSKKYGIITPYTTYLILEDESQISMSPPPIRRNQVILQDKMGSAPAEKAKMDYDSSMEQKEGEISIRSSTEIQELNTAGNLAASKVGRSRMEYTDLKGNTNNAADDLVQVQGRAMYQNNGQWIDGNIVVNANKNLKVNRVQFNSDAYFKLLKEHADLTNILALGKNVNVLIGNEIYEVYE